MEQDVIDKLKAMSPATIDRLLKVPKAKMAFRGISTTKPGSLLKRNIPIRLGNEWNDNIPGFVEIDLVAHCGNTTAGEYVNTLDVTDIYTGWTETRAVLNKAQKHVFEELFFIEKQMPFNYKGIDSDNGSEFINDHLYNYCKKNNICFTRSRPYKKNDGCHVEQKNWQIIRRNIGYDRYEGIDAVNLLNQYYGCLRLYTNFFLPQTKLIDKAREGAKVKKVYEDYLTPYQRVLKENEIPEKIKKELTKIYLATNPIRIKNKMKALIDQLEKIAIPMERQNNTSGNLKLTSHSSSKKD